METSSENTNLNTRAIQSLEKYKAEMLDKLSKLEDSDPDSEVVHEIDRLGGIGIFGMTLERIADISQGDTSGINPDNARFVVGYLNSGAIQNFIVEESNGELTLSDVSEIRDFFVSQA